MSFERRKVRVGRVVGDKMDKTVTVQVEWRERHRRYKKVVSRRARFKVHDADNQSRLGDQVRIIETRPISKTKRWRVQEVLSGEEIAELQPDQIVVEGLTREVAPPTVTEASEEEATNEPQGEEEDKTDEPKSEESPE